MGRRLFSGLCAVLLLLLLLTGWSPYAHAASEARSTRSVAEDGTGTYVDYQAQRSNLTFLLDTDSRIAAVTCAPNGTVTALIVHDTAVLLDLRVGVVLVGDQRWGCADAAGPSAVLQRLLEGATLAVPATDAAPTGPATLRVRTRPATLAEAFEYLDLIFYQGPRDLGHVAATVRSPRATRSPTPKGNRARTTDPALYLTYMTSDQSDYGCFPLSTCHSYYAQVRIEGGTQKRSITKGKTSFSGEIWLGTSPCHLPVKITIMELDSPTPDDTVVSAWVHPGQDFQSSPTVTKWGSEGSFTISCPECQTECTAENSQLDPAWFNDLGTGDSERVTLPGTFGIWNYPDPEPVDLVPGVLTCQECSLAVTQAEVYITYKVNTGTQRISVWANMTLTLALDIVLGVPYTGSWRYDLPKLVVPINTLGYGLSIAGVSLYAGLRAVFNMGLEIESTPVAFRWSPTYVFNAQIGAAYDDDYWGPRFGSVVSTPSTGSGPSLAENPSYVHARVQFDFKPRLEAGIFVSTSSGSASAEAYAYVEEAFYLSTALNYSRQAILAGSNPDAAAAWVQLSRLGVPGTVDCAAVDHHLSLVVTLGITNPQLGMVVELSVFGWYWDKKFGPFSLFQVARSWPVLSACFQPSRSALLSLSIPGTILSASLTLQGKTASEYNVTAAKALAGALAGVLGLNSSSVHVVSVEDNALVRQAEVEVGLDGVFPDAASAEAGRAALAARHESGAFATEVEGWLSAMGITGVTVARMNVAGASPSPSPSPPNSTSIYTPSPSPSGAPRSAQPMAGAAVGLLLLWTATACAYL